MLANSHDAICTGGDTSSNSLSTLSASQSSHPSAIWRPQATQLMHRELDFQQSRQQPRS